MGGGQNELLIGGQAVQRLRMAFPRQSALEHKAEKIITEWLQDREDARDAAKVLKRIKDGKEKTYTAAQAWKQLGI